MSRNQSEYLRDLLSKHSSSLGQVQTFVNHAVDQYQNKIINGRYSIKKSQPNISNKNRSTQDVRSKFHNISLTKKQLQARLEMIEDKLGNVVSGQGKYSHLSDDQRLKFIKQMMKERKQVQNKRHQQLNKSKQRFLQQKNKQKQEQQKQEQDRKEKKKKQLQTKLKNMDDLRNKKIQQMKIQNRILAKKMHEKLLLDKMSDKFQQMEKLSLQQRKKKLAEIRSLHKPLAKEDFKSHLQKIQQMKNQRNKSETDKFKGKISKFYKSSWYNKVKQQPKKYYDELEAEQKYTQKQMKDKSKKYAEDVRQNRKPEIDVKKQEQLKQKMTNNLSNLSLKNQQTRQLGLKYLKIAKQMGSKDQQQASKQSSAPSRYKAINYLQEMKNNHKYISSSPTAFIENINNRQNITEADKINEIMRFSQNLEQKAKRKEQLGKVNNNMADEELDKLYIQAIQAKLSILGKKQ